MPPPPPVTPERTRTLTPNEMPFISKPTSTPASKLRSAGPEHTLASTRTRDETFKANAAETEGMWAGPIPLPNFMNNFVAPLSPDVTKASLDIPSDFRSKGGEAKFASLVQEKLADIMREKRLFPSDTHSLGGRASNGDDGLWKPDFAVLTRDLVGSSATPSQTKTLKEHRHERFFSSVLLFGDLKGDKLDDPCRDITADDDLPEGDRRTQGTTEQASLVRGQLVTYAHSVLMASHRIFVFAFVILPEGARLIRFDASGVVYSELFDFRDEPYLGDFMQRVAAACRVDQGYDPSVNEISVNSEAVTTARRIFEKAHQSRSIPRQMRWEDTFATHSSSDAIYWITDVFDTKSTSFHRVLFYRANTAQEYFGGRQTRGFVGVDLTDQCVIYMKRSWRINDASILSERAVYASLAKNGVRHLPGCYFGGDVPLSTQSLLSAYQESTARNEPFEPQIRLAAIKSTSLHGAKGLANRRQGLDNPGSLTEHILHVVLFTKVGIKLSRFPHMQDMCVALRDAVETHFDAYNCGILHRDVSSANILIHYGTDRKPEGLLIDWDLSGPVDRTVQGPRRTARTGTTEFKAIRLINHPDRFEHMVQDDLEAFLHVLCYIVLRYCPSVREEMRKRLVKTFYAIFSRGNETLNASNKLNYINGCASGVRRVGKTV